MKSRLAFTTALLVGWFAGAANAADTKPTLYIIGDSTVKNHTAGLEGWGGPIAGYFDPDRITVENDALGGRSSRTFLTEGLWAKVDAKLKPGDFVLMQFGHNDGGSVHTSYRASLKGTGDETEDIVNPKTKEPETVHSYGWYLRQYIEDAKAKGAYPIVLSPVPRDIFGPDDKVRRSGARDYGGFARSTAEQEHVPFVDLNNLIAERYDALGPKNVKAQFFPGDHTHTDPAGAELNASCVVEGLRELKNCPISQYLASK